MVPAKCGVYAGAIDTTGPTCEIRWGSTWVGRSGDPKARCDNGEPVCGCLTANILPDFDVQQCELELRGGSRLAQDDPGYARETNGAIADCLNIQKLCGGPQRPGNETFITYRDLVPIE